MKMCLRITTNKKGQLMFKFYPTGKPIKRECDNIPYLRKLSLKNKLGGVLK